MGVEERQGGREIEGDRGRGRKGGSWKREET
jgi:hypothetical protein